MTPNPSSKLNSDHEDSGMIRFGVFEFTFSTSELRRNGILMRLQAQPANVLSYLLSHTDRVVSREELHDTIWGSPTFVDFERGLNVCIAQIRAALGDESSAPRYIRTIPRKGYEFICPVQRLGSLRSPESVTVQRPSRRLLVASLVAVVLITGIIGGYLFARSRSRATAPLVIAVARFDNETGDPAVTSFADALTDDVVARLTDTNDGRLRIIGNASVLRVPRQQRDDADSEPPIPLSQSDLDAILGHYPFGPGENDRIEVTAEKGNVTWTRAGTMGRPLFHIGGRVFYPSGAPAVRISFVAESAGSRMIVRDPDIVLSVLRN
jgi:DNA-binding winged helix-turn-helix (wHTH) protein